MVYNGKSEEKKILLNGWGNQHGTDIEEVMMTKAEYQAEQEKPYYQRQGAYFKDYMTAYYYTMD